MFFTHGGGGGGEAGGFKPMSTFMKLTLEREVEHLCHPGVWWRDPEIL